MSEIHYVPCPYCQTWIYDDELTCRDCSQREQIDVAIFDIMTNIDILSGITDINHLRLRKKNIEKLISSLQLLVSEDKL